MRIRIAFLTTLIACMLVAPGLVGLASAGPAARLVIISPNWEGIRKEFEAAFKAYHLAKYGEDVEFEWLDEGGTSECVKYIDSGFEATPDGIGIDIFWGGGVDPYIAAAEKGQLQRYRVEDEVLSKIPASYGGIPMYDPEYRWYGAALSGFGILYNKAILQLEGLPTPATWEDLADPRLEGWVGTADPRHSGTSHMMVEIILQAYGWDEGMKLLTTMGANMKDFPTSSSQVPESVGAGDIVYGLSVDFYALSEILAYGSDRLGYVMPAGLTVINPDSIGILKGAPDLDVARRFVTFVLTKNAQKIWMLPVGAEGGPNTYVLGRMCVIPELFTELANVSVVPVKNPFEEEPKLMYNSTLGSIRYSLVNDLFGSTIIDTHEDLVSAWRGIIATENTLAEAGFTSTRIEEAKEKLGEAPLTRDEALAAAGQWGNAEARNRYISVWHEFAIEKYQNATKIAALARAELSTHLESEKQALMAQYKSVIKTLEDKKRINLYIGLGGGVVLGAVIGFAISYYMARRKEIEAVKA
jgi:ABC-type Fe3+ transport system substrate-binding protein